MARVYEARNELDPLNGMNLLHQKRAQSEFLISFLDCVRVSIEHACNVAAMNQDELALIRGQFRKLCLVGFEFLF